MVGIPVNENGEAPPLLSDVWQTKDFKSNEFGSVANKEVMDSICGSVANAGVRESCTDVLGPATLRGGS